jgi:acyl-coenzyme A synthetase/AMP-(fatty) acid ligase
MRPDASLQSNVSRIAVIDPSGEWTYEDLYSDPLNLREAVSQNSSVALRTSSALNVAAAVIALDGWASSVHLIPPDVDPSIVTDGSPLIDEFLPKRHINSIEKPTGQITAWILYTSGTTGTPKSIRHTIESLSRTISNSKHVAELTWGVLYDPNRMAGIQVILQSLASLTSVVAPNPYESLQQRVAFLRSHGVDALSATPTLWRQILQVADVDGWNLRQITLGGEISDQKILDALSSQFPESRIAHIFASTETGAAFAVVDRRAGFPVSYLTDAPRGVKLEIRENVLYVCSPLVSGAPADGFVSTEDEIEIVDDRCLFLGRKSGMVNIGGAKVWPEAVERILRTHPQVIDAAVQAKANPFSGAILTAKVVACEGAPEDFSKQLRIWMKSNSPIHFVPATIQVVDSLEISQAGKVNRS